LGIEGTTIKNIIVVKRAGNQINMTKDRDLWWHDLMEKAPLYCEPEPMDSEDMLYLLYTSGTTGNPIIGAYTRSDIEAWQEVMARSIYRQKQERN
jgi:acyl-coenzyme A synthetase/AMP-(fatty) acid ligase